MRFARDRLESVWGSGAELTSSTPTWSVAQSNATRRLSPPTLTTWKPSPIRARTWSSSQSERARYRKLKFRRLKLLRCMCNADAHGKRRCQAAAPELGQVPDSGQGGGEFCRHGAGEGGGTPDPVGPCRLPTWSSRCRARGDHAQSRSDRERA